MELRLTVEGSPPSGLLHHGAEPPLPFAGWLELLRVLSLTVGDGSADPAALDPGGRFASPEGANMARRG
jgi:hypothetical protein